MSVKEQSSSYRFIRPLINLHLSDPSAYLLLVFLCHAAKNKTGYSWHSHASITYTTGMAEKTIRKATKTLAQLGVITCETRGCIKSNRYKVHYDELLALAERGKLRRDEYISAEQDKKTARQRRWRDGQMGVSLEPSETVNTSERDGRSASSETVKTPLVRRSNGRPNYVRELGKRTKEKELEENHISGSQELDSKKTAEVTVSVTAKSIQELEIEVSALKALQGKAISDGRPDEYNTLTTQLHQKQARLNQAHNIIWQASKLDTGYLQPTVRPAPIGMS